jgi:hypothetical protein
MLAIEAPYARAIIREKNRYISRVAEAYALDGTLPEALTFEHRQKMFDISSRYNKRTIRVFATDVYNTTIKNHLPNYEKKNEAFDKWLATIIAQWIANETAVAAVVTANTTRNDIRAAIQASVREGETNPQVVKKILKVKGFSAFRAVAIARTETHNAAMYANKESGKRLERDTGEQLNKVWIPVQDSRTRDSHSAMVNHSAIILDGLFTVNGDRMDRPGDPRGSARNVINCRCTLAYRVEE